MTFQLPVKRITTNEDLDKFRNSSTKEDIFQFIKDLSKSVEGLENDALDKSDTPVCVLGVVNILNKVAETVDRYPPQDQVSTRFGKPEFRDFYDEVVSHTSEWLATIVGVRPNEAIVEVGQYFIESWGNRTRIDYGSGHELNFVSFLLCLRKLGLYESIDYSAVVLKAFKRYLDVMRKIQTAYWLEPAGSHGVWGLDDYHFLPFLFGAAQLTTHKHLRPKSIHDKDILDMMKDKYLYFGCIYFINSVKTTASLRWHSPMLDDISGVKKWAKVNEGLIKMYDAEVLGKLPIIQHFMFGSILEAPEGVSPPRFDSDHDECHTHSTWADCCGIKVPSAIAAKQSQQSQSLRSAIPFD